LESHSHCHVRVPARGIAASCSAAEEYQSQSAHKKVQRIARIQLFDAQSEHFKSQHSGPNAQTPKSLRLSGPKKIRMARSSNAEDKEPSRRVRRRHESHRGLDGEKLYKSRGKETVTLQPDEQGARRIRIERLEGRTSVSTSVGRSPLRSSANMTEESIATPPSLRSTPSHRRRSVRDVRPEEKKHRQRRKSNPKEDERTEYVYGPPTGRPKSSRIISETRKLGRDGETSEEEEERETQSEPEREKRHKEKKIRIIYVSKEEAKSLRHQEKRVKPEKGSSERPRDSEESVRRSRTHRSRRNSIAGVPVSPPKRYALHQPSHGNC
jgi:transcription elongation GreA/GreB family factor